MKKKLFLFLCGAAVVFFIAAFLKDFIYDTPQRCFGIAEMTLGKNQERASEILGGEYSCVYKINYMSLISMGTLKISRSERNEGPMFSIDALSAGSFADVFVRASVRLESYFDKQTNMPYLYSETTSVNDVLKTKEISFDRDNRIAIRDDKKIRINENTYDPVGAVMATFQLPYQGRKEYSTELLSKESLYSLKTKQNMTSKDFFEISLSMKRQDSTSTHGASMTAWLTKGMYRVPLIIKSWTPAGYVSVVLEKIELMSPKTEAVE